MPSTDSRIVVGVDGSDSSIEALRWAKRIADSIGARIEAIATWHYPLYPDPGLPEDYRPDIDASRALDEAVTAAFGAAPPPNLEKRTAHGTAAHLLIQASRGAEMLVVGSRALGGFRSLLVGSVSAQCAEHASCPVLVVHEPKPTTDPPPTSHNTADQLTRPGTS